MPYQLNYSKFLSKVKSLPKIEASKSVSCIFKNNSIFLLS